MSDQYTLLLEHHLKELKLPSFLGEYRKLAAQCATEGTDHADCLLLLSELKLIDRHQRMVQRLPVRPLGEQSVGDATGGPVRAHRPP